MHYPGLFKPGSIANEQPEIQIVDTHEALETRVSIGFADRWHQMNRTLLGGDNYSDAGGRSRYTLDWSPVLAVTLNPERDAIVNAHSGCNDKQPLAA